MAEEPAPELSRAVRSGDVSTARRLLETHPELRAGLDQPMHDGHFGATLLIAAVKAGNRDMVELLLEAGADINQRSHWWAGSFGVLDDENELVPWLIERGARVDAYAAARHGMMDRLRQILEADPGAARMRGGDGQTPLHVAKTVEIATYLLERGAEIDALDVDHESTPAQYLVRDRPEVARFLVSRGCRTDILLAAALGDLELVKEHLARDPSVIRLSVTPEFFPMRNARAGGTIYIWTLGANMIPHTVAHLAKHPEVFEYLMAQSPPALQLAVACEVVDENRARRLVAETPGILASLTAADRRRLPAAATDNRFDAVRLMLALGWPTGERGQEGGTALHWAAFHGNAEMVRELLGHGADRSVRDPSYDGTALNWARYGAEHGWHPERGDYSATIEALQGAGQ
ncbi:MAG TPA: ankyrin repeat domain-containing protein [Gemmatimonadales bacterium]|nr:ankyrin repeat domain-containing protein [Gemmatimonadales bacterium]